MKRIDDILRTKIYRNDYEKLKNVAGRMEANTEDVLHGLIRSFLWRYEAMGDDIDDRTLGSSYDETQA